MGALKVESGVLTQGLVIALYNYMSQILVELIKMANLIITITKAVACGNRGGVCAGFGSRVRKTAPHGCGYEGTGGISGCDRPV